VRNIIHIVLRDRIGGMEYAAVPPEQKLGAALTF
jgi:hypothetical protein